MVRVFAILLLSRSCLRRGQLVPASARVFAIKDAKKALAATPAHPNTGIVLPSFSDRYTRDQNANFDLMET
jgi:hypothetical protein